MDKTYMENSRGQSSCEKGTCSKLSKTLECFILMSGSNKSISVYHIFPSQALTDTFNAFDTFSSVNNLHLMLIILSVNVRKSLEYFHFACSLNNRVSLNFTDLNEQGRMHIKQKDQ